MPLQKHSSDRHSVREQNWYHKALWLWDRPVMKIGRLTVFFAQLPTTLTFVAAQIGILIGQVHLSVHIHKTHRYTDHVANATAFVIGSGFFVADHLGQCRVSLSSDLFIDCIALVYLVVEFIGFQNRGTFNGNWNR